MNHQRQWVRLRAMSSDGSLEQPLLSGVQTNAETYPDPVHSEVPVDAPVSGNSTELSPDISLYSSPEAISPNIQDNTRKKKRLVWADGCGEIDDTSTGTTGSPHLLSPQDDVSTDGRKNRPQSYILFEGQEGEEKGYIHIRRERGRSSFAGNSVVSEGDITEDQFNFKPDFIKVEVPSSNPDGSSITTAQELLICKKTVLKPFLTFLKIIGWRALYSTRQDITPSCWIKLLNIAYPTFLFCLLLLSCVTQVITCFYRDQPVETAPVENGVLIIDCKDDLLSRLIFPDILLLGAYLWGLYIFRFGAPEHLVTLVETVFLSSQHIRNGQAKMVNFMRFILFCGFSWLLFDMFVSIARVFSLQLLDNNAYLYFLLKLAPTATNMTSEHTTPENILRYFFVIYCFFGFIFFDLLYIAVIVTYSFQCQLIRIYIGTIMDKVLTKLQGYTLEQAMLEINKAYKFLQVVNGKLSALTSVCLLVFLEAAVSSLFAVLRLASNQNPGVRYAVLGGIVGVCNTILWSLIAIIPIIQASRLTSRCQQLRRLGLSIGHRPFAYRNTPQLELDSFVQYTNATRYRAKLAGMPVYPSFVIGGLFLLVLGGSFAAIISPTFRSVQYL